MGKVCCSYDVAYPYIYNLEVFGSKGTVLNNRVWARGSFPGQQGWITIPTTTPDSGDVSHHPFPEEVAHFVECILAEKEDHRRPGRRHQDLRDHRGGRPQRELWRLSP